MIHTENVMRGCSLIPKTKLLSPSGLGFVVEKASRLPFSMVDDNEARPHHARQSLDYSPVELTFMVLSTRKVSTIDLECAILLKRRVYDENQMRGLESCSKGLSFLVDHRKNLQSIVLNVRGNAAVKVSALAFESCLAGWGFTRSREDLTETVSQ